MQEATMAATGSTVDVLFETIMKLHNEGKAAYPKSIVAVEHDNAYYFMDKDAILISDLYGCNYETIHYHMACTVIPRSEYNQLASVLHENDFLFIIVMKEEKA